MMKVGWKLALVAMIAGISIAWGSDAPPVAPAAAGLEELRAKVKEGEYEEAAAGARARLAALDREGPADSLDAAETIDVIVESLWRNGDAAESDARALGARALAIKERVLGPDTAGVATTLHHLGVVDFFKGDYKNAQAEWERAQKIRDRVLGPDHLDVAETANALANLYQTTGQFELARPLYERAVAIREHALGPDNPKVGDSLNNLASLLTVLGDYAAALPIAERSVQVKEKALGPDHPKVATSLTNLADIYDQTGNRERARALFERAAKILEKALGPDHPNVGSALNNVAEQLRRDGKFDEAKPLYVRVIAIWEKAHGPEHPRVALALSNYSLLLEAEGQLDEAQKLEERAAAIREKALGPNHPELGESLGHLAEMLTAKGDYAAALPLYERAMAIAKTSLGPAHPMVAVEELGLSRVEAHRGSLTRSFELSLDCERISRDHLRLTGRSFAEEQALRYAAERPFGLDLALSVAVERKGKVPARDLLDALIRSRAVVLDEMAARYRSAAGSKNPEVARLAEQLAAVRSRLANITVRGLGGLDPEAYRALIDRTRDEKERAERALGAASAEFADEQQRARVGLNEVAAALPPKSALVAYVVYRHQALAKIAAQAGAKTPLVAPEKPVLSVAAIVFASGKAAPTVVGLGRVDAIDPLVRRWKQEASQGALSVRRSAAESDAAYRVAGEALRRAVWDPVAQTGIGGADRVFIVPDGSLNLVSFASLPVGDAKFLLERGPTVHYVSAERDLVPGAADAKRGVGLLALGGPDYDKGSLSPKLAAGAPTTRSAGCASFESLRFDPLPAAEREAGEVVALFKTASAGKGEADAQIAYFHGASATEGAFKSAVGGRRLLHLATHGFFLGGDCQSAAGTTRGFKVVDEKPAATTNAGYVSPLLLSGLALAGANQRASASAAQEDGILTAEELAGLDLTGVEWAVLSACDTGVGEIQAGEGVFGLRRAMQLAGVHTLVMSLWPVDDEATRAWMTALYRGRLEDHLDTAAAVRNAGASVLKGRRAGGLSTHPFYWAAFVAAGDWR